VLRLRGDGTARVTIPRGGSKIEAARFAQKHSGWLEQQLLRQASRPRGPEQWAAGTQILFRGELALLQYDSDARLVHFANQQLRVAGHESDLRPAVERYLWRLARIELPPRVFQLAAQHKCCVNRVTVRNQRSRWGSCSRCGTISLNWRLVQTPAFVRDYIILHELAHLRYMNHSRHFWNEVARLCPEFAAAERWLKNNPGLLR
jgi:predicted metal-dependent hydrolase